MASFNLANILFFYFLIYFKFAHSAPDSRRSLSSSVYFTVRGNVANFNYDNMKKILRLERSWMPVYSGTGEGKSVNVQYKKGGSKYHCMAANNVYTYYPKDQCLFNIVRSQTTVNDPEEVLFKTDDVFEMAKIVVYDESDSNKKVVHIHQVNGVIKRFEKKRGVDGWKEIGVKNSGNQLEPEKFEIKTQSEPYEPGIRVEHDDRCLKYTFTGGAKCVNIKYDGKEVMSRFSTDSSDAFPLSVVVYTKENKAFVIFKNSIDIFELDDGELKKVFSGKKTPRSINVLYKGSCDNYDCDGGHKYYLYQAKDDKLFNKVRRHTGDAKDSEEVIFQTDDVLQMANKVEYDETDPNKLMVHIHQLDGMVRIFKKPSDGKWYETLSEDSGSTSVNPTLEASPEAKSTTTKNVNLGGSTSTSETKTEAQPSKPNASELYLDISKIKIMLPDPQDSEKMIECDRSKYTINNSDQSMSTYMLKDGVKCVTVGYDNKVAWKHNPSKTKEYPKSLHFLSSGPIVIEMNDNLFYFSIRKSNGNFESVQMGKFDFKATDIELLTMDSRLDPVILKPERYDLIPHHFFLEYKFPSDTRCEGLKINGEIPWIYNEMIYGEHPSSLYLFANRVLALCGGKSFIRPFDPANPGELFRSREIMKPALAGFKFAKNNDYFFYELDSRFKCTGIKYGGKDLWKHDSSKQYAPYPKSVMFSVRGNTALVMFKNSINIIKYEERTWKSVVEGRPQPVHLSINDRISTDFFEYKRNGDVHTYTAEGLYVFSALVKERIFSGYQKIWRTAHIIDCANKVVLDKTDPNKLVVTIHHVSGLTTTLKNTTNGWEDSGVTDAGSDLKPGKVEILG